MIITEKKEGSRYTIELEGRLDTQTAPAFEAVFSNLSPIITEFVLNLAKLIYISSLGLRAILVLFKKMKARNGKLTIINIPDNIRNVFEMSGFIQTVVHDEKSAVVEKAKTEDSIEYAMSGLLDGVAALHLEQHFAKLKDEEGSRNIMLDCSGLSAITSDACNKIKSIQNNLLARKHRVHFINVPLSVIDSIKAQGFQDLL
ncbi:MAG: STAS domain-containing protein [Spirochaetaceae bacterium]|jgi:anti-sigma B factor antagonist/stage II sporulation protein AA (anti-sigma F factor antagonist)|nr:STAS domain-containing protein [Spirochaetaceae bacterium]